ncbi:organomercurial lyase MerB [Paraburkholderia sp. IMGN_8]|uniref:organomercurial lyase MerB n=1 Tax=Paraburkholderia sp. IMGN_8 TaxID=3136564 RepID=UPI003100EE8C
MDLARYTTELVRHLTIADRSEDFADLFVVLLRELAKGAPVSPATLSATLGWPLGRVATALEHAVGTEWDDHGNVVGYGLTLHETAHVFEVAGRRLYTWCAFDTLFFPMVIDQTARVVSHCAATGAPVSLTVTPEEIRDLKPAGAAVSLLLPQASTDIRHAFCCHVHFFASSAVGHDWASTHAGVDIVNVQDAFAVGRERAQQLLRRVRQRNASSVDRQPVGGRPKAANRLAPSGGA